MDKINRINSRVRETEDQYLKIECKTIYKSLTVCSSLWTFTEKLTQHMKFQINNRQKEDSYVWSAEAAAAAGDNCLCPGTGGGKYNKSFTLASKTRKHILRFLNKQEIVGPNLASKIFYRLNRHVTARFTQP